MCGRFEKMATAGTAPNALRPYVPWLVAFAGFAFDLAAFWPGQMSFDSAYAWWQARGGTSTNIVPPLFVWVWRACDRIVEGPGALFVFHLALFWCGLALLARALRFAPVASAAAMLLVALAPVSLVLRGQVWTDVGLFAALTFATGALASVEIDLRRHWLLFPIALALFYAAALRHNALPAVLPFVAWFMWLLLRRFTAASPARVTVATLVGLLAIACAARWLDASVDRHVEVWPSLAQFDLAAVSIATGQMRLPDFMIGPGLDVAELAQAFRPWSNVPMLVGTQHGIRDPFSDHSAQELATLRTAWLGAITDEPRAWFAHRLRLSRALFGTHAVEWPRELIYVDDEVGYRDNPPIARTTNALHAGLMRAAAILAVTAALAAWPYLVLGLVGGAVAWRRRGDMTARLAAIVLLSAWLYAVPLTMIAPSAELRYLAWPCVASLLAFACAAFAPRSGMRC
ncbi:MAG: hypothetical protein ABIS07_10595 [Dokdonella sp.]